MKKPTRKLIAFSTAMAAFLSLTAQTVSAENYTAETMEECEYDELIQMRDKNILIKDGLDYSIDQNTQLVVIDENGQKSIISKDLGVNGIYNYVSTTMGLYNYIAPTYSPYFCNQSYRLSTEKGTVIVGVGDKFAIMNNDNEIISDKYNNIYRINDDYFIIDNADETTNGGYDEYGLTTGMKYSYANNGTDANKSGLMKSDGTVIVPPTDGVCAYYLCTDKEHFLVSTKSGDYFIDLKGNKVSDVYPSIVNVGIELSVGNGIHYDGQKYANDYTLTTDLYMVSESEAGLRALMNSDFEVISDWHKEFSTIIEDFGFSYAGYDERTFIGTIAFDDASATLYDKKGNLIFDKADEISFDEGDKDTSDDGTFTVIDDGMISVYDQSFKLLSQHEVHERDIEINDMYHLTIDGTEVQLWNESYSESKPLAIIDDEAGIQIESINFYSNSWQTDNYVNGADFCLGIEGCDINNEPYTSYKSYIVDSDFNVFDVSEYSNTEKLANGLVAVRVSEDSGYQIIDSSYNVIQSFPEGFTYLHSVYSDVRDENNLWKSKLDYYIVSSSSAFTICDAELNIKHENIKGHLADDGYSYYTDTQEKYGIFSFDKGVICQPMYDSVQKVMDKYIVTKDNQTLVLDADANPIQTWDGVYSFPSGTFSAYASKCTLNKRENDVTSTIVYNAETDSIEYQQEGKYDYVSEFYQDYAVVTIYGEDESEDLWTESSNTINGLIKSDGTEVIPPTSGLRINLECFKWINWSKGELIEEDLKIWMYLKRGFGSGYYTLNPDEIDYNFAKENEYTLAFIDETGNYKTLRNLLWGMAEKDGTVLFEPQFEDIYEFHDGIAIANLPETVSITAKDIRNDKTSEPKTCYKYALISSDGRFIVEPTISEPEARKNADIERLNDAYLTVESIYYIDGSFYVLQCFDDGTYKYTEYNGENVNNDFAVKNGYDLAQKIDHLYYVEKDGLAGIVAADNTPLVPVEYKNILSFTASHDSIKYARSPFGNILAEEYSSKVRNLSDGSMIVSVQNLNDKIGMINITGEGEEPTEPPTELPTESPTEAPTETPTEAPTETPTEAPTEAPTEQPTEAPELEIGDVTDDGNIDAVDASYVLTAYAMKATGQATGFNDVQNKAADVNDDGNIDSVDASWILSYYAYTATGGKDSFEKFLNS